MSRPPSRKIRNNEEKSLSRIERFGEGTSTIATASANRTQSSVSFVRRIIPQQEVDVYTVKTETTTKVQRIRKKKKSCKLRMAGEASFGSFMAGPQYQHLETPKQQFRGVSWLTTEIASLFPRTQKAVETALGELLIYTLFVIVILIVIVNLNVHGKYHYGQYLRRNLIGRPQNYRHGLSSSEKIESFDQIFTQKQMFRTDEF
ncbi:uncharacterized protein LOC123294100 [Chrysoperla carnea]|uniref:uncharacterized protein LOC123294100 n=1 Tax=Chrysoperla carnea TaxID=189513 RepID=UPI001D06882D|nr:uncharacterized protein LOC123294100 [Chrysoperla carnea]